MRRLLEGRGALALIAAAAAVPRLAALAFERGDILAEYVEKSDSFALSFVETGTFGLVPGEPSAYTQPLYGFFLVPLYWLFGHSWLAVGLAQIALAVATALLVYAIGLRVVSRPAAAVAALLATLHPYLVWHDVHVNREIVDQLVAATLALGYLLLARRPTAQAALLAGTAGGLAVLGNARLAGLPLVLALVAVWERGWSRRALATAAASFAVAAVVVSPWVVRNQVQLGCFAITTDARALWKANNPLTYDILASGRWIDDVPDLPGAPPTPADAEARYERTGDVLQIDECALMSFYRERVFDFWREQPGEKARLSAQAVGMLWNPLTTETAGRPGEGTWLDFARRWPEALWALAVFAAALLGLRTVDPAFRRLALAIVAYVTLTAVVFVGATRYRVPFDFVFCILAASTLDWLHERRRRPA
ncbi:MAG TPA: glycosyltransferase family 39 protein [Gaiellaceae bacterium]|nr:glycosyltransferase family 39 protein [Gaiellaceae bacterium]